MLSVRRVVVLFKRREFHPLVVVCERVAGGARVIRVMDRVFLLFAVDLEELVRGVKSIRVPIRDVDPHLVLSLVRYRMDIFVAEPMIPVHPTETVAILEPVPLELCAAICPALEHRPRAFVVEQTVDFERLASRRLDAVHTAGSTPVVEQITAV